MNIVKRLFTKTFAVLIFLILASSQNSVRAADGEALFKANCASCHKPLENYVGPPLKGAREREPSKDWVYKWVANTTSMVHTDPYAKKLMGEHGGVVMTAFPDLPKADIDAILDWADKYEAPGAKPGAPGAAGATEAPKSDNTLLY